MVPVICFVGALLSHAHGSRAARGGSIRMSSALDGGRVAAQPSAVVAEAMSSFARCFAQQGTTLSSDFCPDVKVTSLLWPSASRSEWEQQIGRLARFLIEPKYEVLSVRCEGDTRATVEWMLSGNWPLPWRPRALALGESALELRTSPTGGAQVASVREKLTTSLLELVLMQLLPNWEDVWNLYNSPPAETRPYRVVRKGKSYELRWVPPALSLQLDEYSSEFPSESTNTLSTPLLPSFAFTSKPLKNNDVWSAIRPLSVECDQSQRAVGGPCRYRWTVPLPSRLGSDASRLPSLSLSESETGSELEDELEPGVAEQRYVRVPGRTIAVRRTAGWYPSDAAALAEADKLIAELRQDGIACAEPAVGATRPPIWLSQYNSKIGFTPAGRVAIAQYQGTVDPLRRNEIAVEVLSQQ